ncbi:MAG: radical SAM family heme chaperone HemW [Bacteroidales bacterium]|nr:radical SAM family heme chaperone HemW [Bacteroidales bacterium]
MNGIYIHIPFCRQKCNYCNFFSIASLRYNSDFIKALLIEIKLQKEYFSHEKIKTIYFGGGTPSMLSIGEINSILNAINDSFSIEKNTEITIEANPDDLSVEKIIELKNSSINRISVGIQSFNDDDLHYLNRKHNSEQAKNSIPLLKDFGFENISIDLIYGIPTLTEKNWDKNLDIFFSMEIPHLSAYSLTVEKKTILDNLIRKGKAENISESQSIQHFKHLINRMEEKNYIHYEISNFSKPDCYSKHNSIYWTGGKYLGLGPSAHSFNGNSRQWNVANLSKYIQSLKNENVPAEIEILNKNRKYNEYIMTSLRTIWGCKEDIIKEKFGENYLNNFLKTSEKHLQNRTLIFQNEKYILTKSGKLFADGIASDFFI